jgi:hypothetical protein
VSSITHPSTGRHAARGFPCPPSRVSSGRSTTRASHAGTSGATSNGRAPRSCCPWPFNLAAGEVFSVAVPPASVPRFFAFASVYHFVESLPCCMPRKPASIGEGTFQISTKGFILSIVLTKEGGFARKRGELRRDYFVRLPPITAFRAALGVDGVQIILFCSSRCNCTRSFLAFRVYHFLVFSTKLLFQRIHGGSFDRKSLFVTFHEGPKAINIPLIRSYRRAIVPCKDFVGEIGFQGFILFLTEHIGGQ